MTFRRISVVRLVLLFEVIITITHATTIDVVNNCGYQVWAAADPGSGKQLNPGATWQVRTQVGSTKTGRIWGRTGCNFNADGNGKCDTGGCGKLDCDPGHWGNNPKTVFEYALAQPNNQTILDISLIDGFNIPMTLTPTSNTGGTCRQISCTADINGQCPQRWKVTHGCYNPCTKTEFGSCAGNGDSVFFKHKCPDAFSFPTDAPGNSFSCPSGTNYKLSFC